MAHPNLAEAGAITGTRSPGPAPGDAQRINTTSSA
jgi:hypothetical protein